jgi:hypothetical protein
MVAFPDERVTLPASCATALKANNTPAKMTKRKLFLILTMELIMLS